MHRALRNDAEAPGHDSFLDIVANMVGILIILVMVVGMRVKNAPVAAIPGPAAEAVSELQEDRAVEESLRGDAFRAADAIRNLQREERVQRRRRDALALMASALQRKIQSRRDQMDAHRQALFELKRELSEARRRLEPLERQRIQAENARPEPIVIQSYPTPLSQTVNGREAHFQLRGGRIAAIPLEQLVEQLKRSAQRQKYKLLDLPELTDTVGPLGGFRLRYTLARYEVSPEMSLSTGRGGSYARLKRWTLIPVSGHLGEPVEPALAEGSEFRRALSKLRPGRHTITLWVYPDSFPAFRRIREELYAWGYSVAARPLPPGVPISGSPKGSKSAAQ